MDTTKDPLFEKLHRLIVRLLEDSLLPGELEELTALLEKNPEARRAYVYYIQESACLRWLCVEDFDRAVTLASPSNAAGGRQRRIGWILAGILASALVVIATVQFAGSPIAGVENHGTAANVFAQTDATREAARGGTTRPDAGPATVPLRSVVATVTGLNGVRWDGKSVGARLLSRCMVGDRFKLQEGAAELTFDVGVQVKVFGPADFEITSPNSIRCLRGRATTLVDKRGRGFWIETPRAKVVDLGTQFGLSISDAGDTEVVVFQGMVDLSYSSQKATGDAASRRMEQGEALLLRNSGELERVVSVQRNNFMGATHVAGRRPTEPVIGDVRDNIRSADSAKSYQIVHGGFDEDVPAFVDRNHQWNGMTAAGIPEFLTGADYIMPFNDDKFVSGLELKLRIIRPATMYIFLDNNMDAPAWLKEQFTDTGVDIGLDGAKTEWHRDQSLGTGPGKSVDLAFSIWKREIPQPGTVTLGGLAPPKDRRQGFNMYGIAAVANNGAVATAGGR